jgi:2,3-bisphosphoglycerate-dependent phosphoglycerate mutase
MQFFFIRHAQSTNNALDARPKSAEKRNPDPILTGVGVEQARKLARFLAEGDAKEIQNCHRNGFHLTHLYCSLMVRAVHTGTILAKELDLSLTGLEEVHECGGIYSKDEQSGDVTCLPGKDKAYYKAHYPELVLPETMVETGWWDSRPVERPEDSLKRARNFLRLLLERHANESDRIGIVSHGGFYNDLLANILDLPGRNGTWYSLYNTGVTRIDFHDDLIELVYQNRVDHLPCELIT